MQQPNVLGQKIAQLRRARGITQVELAEQLHFTYQAISNWERGVSEPNAETLLHIAAFFGVSTDELLGKSPASSVSPDGEPFTAEGGRQLRGAPPVYSRGPRQGGGGAVRHIASEYALKDREKEAQELHEEILPQRKDDSLRIALIIFTICTLAGGILSFFRGAIVYFFVISAILAALIAYFASIVLFFRTKAPSASVATRILYIASILLCEASGVILLFLPSGSVTVLIILTGIVLCFGVLREFIAPFAFRRTDEEGRLKRYLIIVSVYFALTFVSAFLPAGLQAVFDFAAQILRIAVLWCLYKVLADREAGVDYAAENRIIRIAWWRKNFRKVLFWSSVGVFLLSAVILVLCDVLKYRVTWPVGEIPYEMLPYSIGSAVVAPTLYVSCLWCTKAGAKNRAVHWALLAMWIAVFILEGAYSFLRLCPYSVGVWEQILCALIPFAVFIATVMSFPERTKQRRVRLLIRCIAVSAAAVLSAGCLCLQFSFPDNFVGSMALLCGYLVLLFGLSFFQAERLQRSPNAAAEGDSV